jgi:hypothetical protein
MAYGWRASLAAPSPRPAAGTAAVWAQKSCCCRGVEHWLRARGYGELWANLLVFALRFLRWEKEERHLVLQGFGIFIPAQLTAPT